ncbi:hypothetical protein CHGG_00369 [Chaetomium globosum CBS 148.51]|uniref:Centrosomin N-terminal motif 1 domain-containing protein n=1 Tax=Chaetomium globosum (strain ATCC 6205 / CBS 148.51 / DSM 1962 / NBRC 6347 / NRRL 1970) TaxID=306901 RepID=Q2HHD5_CHAGB|nr:uncharacterized protein CHGG_00369 [Chaetomium globosum CBS 148.51]EAQ92134.1 hypothetical protein CHGG_00369 [Chaetomium globosum CBS 148.51]
MDDHDEGRQPVSRPSTARKLDSDDDPISPSKQNVEQHRPTPDAASLRPENIPPLHPPSLAVPESSYFESPSMNLRHSDSQAEIIVRQHLQDFESSFTAPLSPLPATKDGLDDTFAFDSPSKKPVSERPAPNADESTDQSQVLPTRSRTVSSHPGSDASMSQASQEYSREHSEERASADAGQTPGQALKTSQRPKYLRSRIGSQRSSVSSLHTDPDSDTTVGMGADYALQSGGAVPSVGMPRSFSNALSRSISMGSMASGIENLHDSSGPAFGHLETLDEVDVSMSPQPEPRRDQNRGLLQTPETNQELQPLPRPTDTVIARHVRDVQVPESLAKEYKNRGGLLTPARPGTSETAAFGTSTASRHGRSLTLKEQSSTIERLSKENFDLKLKVMFLSDRLDKLSEEGIKEMISENVELKTGLAVLQRDNKVLRRRVKELEKQAKDEENRPGTAKSTQSDDEQSAAYDQETQEREEELIYLREQLEEHITEIERLRNENLNREAEKRRMADVVRTLGERTGERLGEDFERQEEADVWKDLLEQETARREQSDEDNRRLRDEIFQMKQELAAQSGSGSMHPMHHTTNIYNITKKSRERALSAARSGASVSGIMDANGPMSVGSTLVDEIRRESEQLRHENAELRREVGAQTSMLTSRNREKDRLYQEIEDLKMAQRRGGPAPSTIDSLLERSASRAGVHERSHSRASGGTRATNTAIDDADVEELENRMADLRDKNNDLKLQNQDLQRELDGCMEDFEAAVEAKKQAEELVAALQEDLETAMNDLMALQAERDEALQEHSNLENEFEALRKEAQEEIDALEGEADQRTAEIERLQLDLNDRTESFDSLQAEMRKMSEGLVRLEDEQEAKLRRVQQLEQELGDANKDLEDLEAKLIEANDKANRLSVQQESSQGEIAFLREEQETDKIRIGDLEAAFANAEQSLREEKERARELEQRLAAERRQREIVANREKEEVQQFVNELNKETSTAKDEVRRLRKSLSSREVEATEWKERLIELENNLREALGDLSGTSSQSKIKVVEKDLWREYQTLESHLEQRTKKLDRLEAIVRNSIVTGQITPHSHSLTETQARLVRLEDAYRQLKVENHTLRAAAEARRAAYAAADHNGGLDSPGGGSPSPSVPTGPKAKASASKIPKSGSSNTTSNTAVNTSGGGSGSGSGSGGAVVDTKWMLRLRDLEYKLKAEREGRIMDRGEAMKLINASENENAALRGDLEKERERRRAGR